jgi:hypothetical protein
VSARSTLPRVTLKPPPCGIPSNCIGPCDLEWGHDGDMHANAGDGFHAPKWHTEHRRRQATIKRRTRRK